MSFETLMKACQTQDTDTAKAVLAQHPELAQQKDGRGLTPLIMAAYTNAEGIVDLLLEHKVDVNLPDLAKNTALMGCCFKGYANIATKLIEAGADLNAQNAQGSTALHFAATYGQPNMVKLLLEKGAKTDLLDKDGMSPLALAKQKEDAQITALLQ
jgi:ankyrin repeat protein